MAITPEERRARNAAHMRAKYRNNPESGRERGRAEYARNREAHLKRKKTGRDQDRESFNVSMRAWRAAHPEKVSQYKKRENPELRRARAKRWRDKNRERVRELKRESYWRNRETNLARQREKRRALDPLARREEDRRRYHANREAALANAAKRRNANREAYRQRQRDERRKKRGQYLIYQIRKTAKKKGLAFDLTIDWVDQRLSAGFCEMSGLPFDMNGTRTPHSPSVDRRDPRGGYTKANCRVILWYLNRSMSNLGEEFAFEIWGAVLARQSS